VIDTLLAVTWPERGAEAERQRSPVEVAEAAAAAAATPFKRSNNLATLKAKHCLHDWCVNGSVPLRYEWEAYELFKQWQRKRPVPPWCIRFGWEEKLCYALYETLCRSGVPRTHKEMCGLTGVPACRLQKMEFRQEGIAPPTESPLVYADRFLARLPGLDAQDGAAIRLHAEWMAHSGTSTGCQITILCAAIYLHCRDEAEKSGRRVAAVSVRTLEKEMGPCASAIRKAAKNAIAYGAYEPFS
jgi:hypothetical protein